MDISCERITFVDQNAAIAGTCHPDYTEAAPDFSCERRSTEGDGNSSLPGCMYSM